MVLGQSRAVETVPSKPETTNPNVGYQNSLVGWRLGEGRAELRHVLRGNLVQEPRRLIPACQVSGSEFRVSGFGFRVSGLGFRVSGFGSQAWGVGF